MHGFRSDGEGAISREEWDTCTDAALMLKLLGKVSGPPGGIARRPLVLSTSEIARLAMNLQPKSANGCFGAAIDLTERWAKGEPVTPEELASAANLAEESAPLVPAVGNWMFPAPARSYEDLVAMIAAYTTRVAFGDADVAGSTATLADEAVSAFQASIQWPQGYSEDTGLYLFGEYCADIVRKHYPQPPEASS
jgi:hypothetical protein